jgi:quercetin dioxygenase-like cupin family protein
MIHHRTGARVVAVAAFVASALIAVPAQGTPASMFVGTVEWEGRFGDIDVKPKSDRWHLKLQTKGDSDVVVTRIAIGVGGTSGWHTHPGSSLVTVTAGEITLYDAALCTGRTLTAGQTFVDEGGGHLHLVRNESAAPAEVGAVQIMPVGVPRRIDAPRPNNCEPTVQ